MAENKDLKQLGNFPAVSVTRDSVNSESDIVYLLRKANEEVNQELQNARVLIRNLVAAMSKRQKAKSFKDVKYWDMSVNAWRDQVIGTINKKQPKDYDALNETYNELRMFIDLLSKDSRISGDLVNRFDAFVFSVLNERKADLTLNKG